MNDKPGVDIAARLKERMKPKRLKRFFKHAACAPCDDGMIVQLDGRAVKTPRRQALIVPSEVLAQAIAAEWAGQGEMIDPAGMPLTRMASTAIDLIGQEPSKAVAEIRHYGATDMLFYRASSPAGLVAQQAQHWDPVLEMAGRGIRARACSGLMRADRRRASPSRRRCNRRAHQGPSEAAEA